MTKLVSRTIGNHHTADYGRNHPAPVRTIARYTALHQDQDQLAAKMLEMARDEGHMGRAPLNDSGRGANNTRIQIGKDIRAKITNLLRESGPMGGKDISLGMGRHQTTISNHLRAMVNAGHLTFTGTVRKIYRVAE